MITRVAIVWLQWAIYAFLSARLEPLYSYSGIQFATPAPAVVVFSLLSLGFVAAMLNSAVHRPSDVALWLLASFVVVPTVVVAGVNPSVASSVGLTASAAVLLGFTIPAAMVRWGDPATGLKWDSTLSRNAFVLLVVAISALAMATIIIGYGITALDLSIGDEYERRAAAAVAASPYPGANYLVSAYKTVLIPLAFVLAWVWRLPGMAILGATGVLLVFSFSGEKSIWVTPLLALMTIFSMKRAAGGSRRPWLAGGIVGGLLLAPILLTMIWPASALDVLITRRIGLVPGVLTNRYVEFADLNGFTGFSQSWLKWFNSGENAMPLGVRVGAWLDPDGALNANANLWADGYASAGFIGVVLVSILLGVTLRFLDKIAAARDVVVVGATLGVVCMTFTNGYFHTALLTDGVIFGALLMLVSPPIAENDRRKEPYPVTTRRRSRATKGSVAVGPVAVGSSRAAEPALKSRA